MSTRDLISQQPTVSDEQAEPAEAHRPEQDRPALFEQSDTARHQQRWEQIQTAFVDDPRRAVEEADELVATVMRELAERFATEREGLEGQWSRGEDVSTEDLRVALQRYRSFFQRLLST